MVKGWVLRTFYLKSVDSTQKYIKQILKKETLPFAVVSDIQTDGIGSRDNSWQGLEGNLFFSFALSFKDLPKDLKLESSSIYFAYILKDILFKFGSKTFLKWPNDFYVGDAKIGGTIVHVVGDVVVCGIGLNLKQSPMGFGTLDIDVSREELLKQYFLEIEKKILWKQVFSKYKLEFHENKKFFVTYKEEKISLKGAILQDDGSIIINGERIFSSR